MSGVDMPRLGSYQDVVLRQYLVKKASTEVYKHKLFTYMAMAMTSLAKDPKPLLDAISSTWNDYVNMEMFQENITAQKEQDMREEYDFWKKVKPKINIGKDGKLSVSGLPT